MQRSPSQRKPLLFALFALLLLCLPSCYSLGQQPETYRIHAPGVAREVLAHRMVTVGRTGSWGAEDPGGVIVGFLTYPLDILISTYLACYAPFAWDYDIAWGPLGAIAGITLPGVTLFVGPYVGPTDLAIQPDQLRRLLQKIDAGEGPEALTKLAELRGFTFKRIEVRSTDSNSSDYGDTEKNEP